MNPSQSEAPSRVDLRRFWPSHLLVLLVLICATGAKADTIFWGAGTADWFGAQNWLDHSKTDQDGNFVHQVPGPGDVAVVGNGGTPQIVASGASAQELDVNSGSTLSLSAGGSMGIAGVSVDGTFTQFDGSHSSTNLTVGNNIGSTGTYNLQSGSLSTTNEIIGNSGSGLFTQTGGTHTTGSLSFTVQGTAGSIGTYDFSGGQLNATSVLTGSATFRQSGGTQTVTSFITVGGGSGRPGLYEVSGGSISSPQLWIVGPVFNHSSGNVSIGSSFSIGATGGASAYNLSGDASLTTTGTEQIARGAFNQTGGTNHTAGIQLGTAVTGSGAGTYTLSGGGSLVSTGTETIGTSGGSGVFIQSGGTNQASAVNIGNNAGGTYNQSGGTNTVTNSLRIPNSVGHGDYLLSGGNLTVKGTEFIGNNGSGTLTQNGGAHSVSGILTVGTTTGSQASVSLHSGTTSAAGIIVKTNGTFTNEASLTLTGASILIAPNGGTFEQASSGDLTIQISGSGDGQFGKICSGDVRLDGKLNVTLLNGYTPKSGDSIPIILASNRSGTFTNTIHNRQTSNLVQSAQYFFLINYTPTGVSLICLTAADVFNNPISLQTFAVDSQGFMSRYFTPQYLNVALTPVDAALLFGQNINHFNWVQWIIADSSGNNPWTFDGQSAVTPYFLDPPFGGYSFPSFPGSKPQPADYYPFYYNEPTVWGSPQANNIHWWINADPAKVHFHDRPTFPPNAANNAETIFETMLVGVTDTNDCVLLPYPNVGQIWTATPSGYSAGSFFQYSTLPPAVQSFLSRSGIGPLGATPPAVVSDLCVAALATQFVPFSQSSDGAFPPSSTPSGNSITYQISGSNSPTSYSASGLPSFLTLDPTTGIISGTPTTSGSYYVTISASNATGTGSATLTIIVANPNTYQSWQAGNLPPTWLLNADFSGPGSAPYGDGVPNLVKYALGMTSQSNPMVSLPSVGLLTQGGVNSMTLTYTKNDSALDVTYSPEWSSDLKTWTTEGLLEEMISDDGTFKQMRSSLPIGGTQPLFMRLRVTQP